MQPATNLRIGISKRRIDMLSRIGGCFDNRDVFASGFGGICHGDEIAGEEIIERLGDGKLATLGALSIQMHDFA